MKEGDNTVRDGVYEFVRAESINNTSIKGGIFFISFVSIFLLAGIVGIVDFAFLRYFDWTDRYIIVVPIVFFLFGTGGIVLGTLYIKKQRKKHIFETNVLSKGEAVVASIIRYKCLESIHRNSSGNSSTTYHVSFDYCYNDFDGRRVTKSFESNFGYRPQLFKGSKIMVAIDGESSVVLKSFWLKKHSQAMLKEQVRLDEEANFDGLDGTEIDVEKNSIKYSAEFSQTSFWAGIAIMIFCLVVFVPLYIVFAILIDILVPKLIFIGILAAVNIPLLVFSFYLVFKGRRLREKEKRILDNCKFALANYSVPSTVYSEKERQFCTFCFIDSNGKKRSYNITSRTAELLINKNCYGIAAYTDNEAILIIDYKIKG